jgi:high-affinity nickel permease
MAQSHLPALSRDGHSNPMDWKILLALVSCAVLGLRHGFDYDHLAAISDITAVQRSWKQGLRLGLTYAVGHAATVVLLGAAVIMLHLPLPARLDAWAERLIGVTLVLLGFLVIGNLLRRNHSHGAMESRIALLISSAQWAQWRVRRIFEPHLRRPQRFQWNYSGGSVFLIGALHGLGAETPSQLLLFLLAASLGGPARGFLGLGAFALGLIVMNGIMTATLGGIFGASQHRPRLFRWVAIGGAAYSFIVGIIFILGASGKLPPLGD